MATGAAGAVMDIAGVGWWLWLPKDRGGWNNGYYRGYYPNRGYYSNYGYYPQYQYYYPNYGYSYYYPNGGYYYYY
ncbi:MAG: hypothetical protein U0903_01940 [Planctomycetales bacterium]